MDVNSINSLNTATTNVTTAAYVTICASTPFNTINLLCTDTTTKILKVAVGAAGLEKDLFQIPLSTTTLLPLSLSQVPAGSRLSVKAIDANASSGYCVVTVLS